MNAEETFRSIAPGLIARLMGDFPIGPTDGFAITGNGGHESLGFTKLQEMKPTVKGSRGGWGLMQWTGPRRRAFEAYCKRNKLDPASLKANYAWLFLELKGAERKAINKVRDASGLGGKVEAFELAFLRAGVKHYPSRLQWAKIAEDAWAKADLAVTRAPTPAVEQKAILLDEAAAAGKRAENSGKGAVLGTGTTVTAGAGAQQLADLLLVGLGIGLAALTIWLIVRAVKNGATSSALKNAALSLSVNRRA